MKNKRTFSEADWIYLYHRFRSLREEMISSMKTSPVMMDRYLAELGLSSDELIELLTFNEKIELGKGNIPDAFLAYFLQLQILKRHDRIPDESQQEMIQGALKDLGVGLPRFESFGNWFLQNLNDEVFQISDINHLRDRILVSEWANWLPFFDEESISTCDVARATTGTPITPDPSDKGAAILAQKLLSDPKYVRSQMTPEQRKRDDSAEMLVAAITAGIGLILSPVIIGIPILLYGVWRMFAISFRA